MDRSRSNRSKFLGIVYSPPPHPRKHRLWINCMWPWHSCKSKEASSVVQIWKKEKAYGLIDSLHVHGTPKSYTLHSCVHVQPIPRNKNKFLGIVYVYFPTMKHRLGINRMRMTMTHAHDARANMKEKAYGLMDSLPDTPNPNPTRTHTHKWAFHACTYSLETKTTI